MRLIPVVADSEQVTLLYSRLREFCHDMRNELSLYRMKIYLASRSGEAIPPAQLDEIETRYQALERFIVGIQTICRPMEPTLMTMSLDMVLEERSEDWEAQFGRRGRRLRGYRPPQEVDGALDPSLVTDAPGCLRLLASGGGGAGDRGDNQLGCRAEPDPTEVGRSPRLSDSRPGTSR